MRTKAFCIWIADLRVVRYLRRGPNGLLELLSHRHGCHLCGRDVLHCLIVSRYGVDPSRYLVFDKLTDPKVVSWSGFQHARNVLELRPGEPDANLFYLGWTCGHSFLDARLSSADKLSMSVPSFPTNRRASFSTRWNPLITPRPIPSRYPLSCPFRWVAITAGNYVLKEACLGSIGGASVSSRRTVVSLSVERVVVVGF